ncbi:hypothetical protein LEP1GSC045_0147 [Leptospira interrogans serovar Pomona str. Kennewicki LC82-25]|nr:hypothetical protein LEP1GSC045_0147 [Leptospira interrogans serovar Pomona str. Kennewicki LC82-25]EKR81563.1 hypothetical protein LEP1GSC099_2784 [Leptospira interrogans str. UI 08452]EMF33129.1 hypothetical protein LEP1GSC201_1478 [Leptospira interrogans serovar Pomona str. Fox 32256]EMJ64957.1 hypothetical protein LEP1GSC197_0576 [Leptospira interrogans serovar Pomona str. CSL4002]EMN35078.1 hypothetical protein LEP1GSC084_3818 [Leptospira interrogans serovar Medanensis str. L0448]EMN39
MILFPSSVIELTLDEKIFLFIQQFLLFFYDSPTNKTDITSVEFHEI